MVGLVRLVHPLPVHARCPGHGRTGAPRRRGRRTGGAPGRGDACHPVLHRGVQRHPRRARRRASRAIQAACRRKRAARPGDGRGALAGPAGLVLAALAGPAAAAVALMGYGIGLAYDLRLKASPWSWLPYAAGIPLLPVYAWVGATGELPLAILVLAGLGVFGGGALAIANACRRRTRCRQRDGDGGDGAGRRPGDAARNAAERDRRGLRRDVRGRRGGSVPGHVARRRRRGDP